MMTANGYAKLIEECGELLQVLGKRLAYYHTEQHPDQGPPLYARMEDEIGDVIGACRFVIEANSLDAKSIEHRAGAKLSVFRLWHSQQDNNRDAIDRAGLETPVAVHKCIGCDAQWIEGEKPQHAFGCGQG